MATTPIEFISTHPKIATIVCLLHLFAGYKADELMIPTWLMQWVQMGAWTITITVGAITIWTSINKYIKKQTKK